MMKKISIILIFVGLGLILFIFGPFLKEETDYAVNKMVGISYYLESDEASTFKRPITVPNIDFSIIIPKLNAAAPIVAEVDSTNSKEYLKALKSGVAHAAGTAYPGQVGNTFLFAHSTDTFYNVGKYNAVFFLVGHLENGDEVDVYYKGRLYKYYVYDKKVVDAKDVKYLGSLIDGEKTLTLQTCYPPGTTIKRLVVLAKEAKD